MEKTSTMKQARTSVLVALALICVVSCAKIDDESSAVAPEQPARPTVLLPTRSYEEALSLARKSIALVDRGQTRSATARSIRSERGQCVTTPSTRSGAGSDTLMYVFNFEDNDGFSVIAANRAVDPVLAVAEKGNYTYGEPTGVENFDFYMDAMAQSLAVISRRSSTRYALRLNSRRWRSMNPGPATRLFRSDGGRNLPTETIAAMGIPAAWRQPLHRLWPITVSRLRSRRPTPMLRMREKRSL